MSIEAPAGAGTVELLGDFTLWEPVPMRRRNGRWEIELEVGPGTHHYGFLVDDEWHVPDDTRDVVPDEWGRLSAILVIEGVE
jgi:1,4-alpha-glucan branching enzyme